MRVALNPCHACPQLVELSARESDKYVYHCFPLYRSIMFSIDILCLGRFSPLTVRNPLKMKRSFCPRTDITTSTSFENFSVRVTFEVQISFNGTSAVSPVNSRCLAKLHQRPGGSFIHEGERIDTATFVVKCYRDHLEQYRSSYSALTVLDAVLLPAW